MIPCEVVIAQAEYSVCPTKYRLSKTFCGSAYHVSRGGAAGAPPARPAAPPALPRFAAPPVRGAGGVARPTAPLHTGWNTPSHIVPAAARAASMCFCASAETPGADVGTGPGGANCASANVELSTANTEPRTEPTRTEKREPGRVHMIYFLFGL